MEKFQPILAFVVNLIEVTSNLSSRLQRRNAIYHDDMIRICYSKKTNSHVNSMNDKKNVTTAVIIIMMTISVQVIIQLITN